LPGLPNRGPPVAPTRGPISPSTPAAAAPVFAVFQAFTGPRPQTLTYDLGSLDATTNNAHISADTNWTAGTATLQGTPAQFIAAAQRKTVTIGNPTDGGKVYLGTDTTVSPDTGLALYPGNKLTISGYNGAVWVVSAGGPTPIYYKVT
jgi:hypothetical protein